MTKKTKVMIPKAKLSEWYLKITQPMPYELSYLFQLAEFFCLLPPILYLLPPEILAEPNAQNTTNQPT
jgi:hypothetical protein